MTEGLIFDIKRFAVHDGPGIRTSVFFKGCPLKCLWCHNPEGISCGIELITRKMKLDEEFFEVQENIGRKINPGQLMTEILLDQVFFEESGGGVTFTGGEPLQQTEFLVEILKKCRERNISTVVDTSGYASQSKIELIGPYTDLFLYDLKLINNVDHKSFTGVLNNLILNNLSYLVNIGAEIIIRIPIIPGYTDSTENIQAIRDYLITLKENWEIHLLPYHNTAVHKYQRLGKKKELVDIQQVPDEWLNWIKVCFEEAGFRTMVGG